MDSSDSFELSDGIAVLERTPSTFRALLSGLPDFWIVPNEGPDTFSAFDNVGHLIHGIWNGALRIGCGNIEPRYRNRPV